MTTTPPSSAPTPSSTGANPISVSLAHAAAGVNAVPGSLHWGPADLIAYGAGPAVLLYDQGAGRVRASLVAGGNGDGDAPSSSESDGGGGDLGRVCCVRWKGPDVVRDFEKARKFSSFDHFAWAELASGTSKGAVVTWRVRVPVPTRAASEEDGTPPPRLSPSCCDLQWEQTSLLRVEGGEGIAALAWHEEEEEDDGRNGEGGRGPTPTSALVVLAGTSATVWARRASPSRSCPWSLCQRLSLSPRLAHAISLSSLDASTPSAGGGGEGDERNEGRRRRKQLVLAVGAVDGTTLLFLEKEKPSAPSSPPAFSPPSPCLPLFSELPAAAARGHGDWVRGVAFTVKKKKTKTKIKTEASESESGAFSSHGCSSSLLMATASNDRTVRVWEISPSSSSSGGSGGGEGRARNGIRDLDDDDDVAALASPSSKPSASSSSSSPLSVRLVATLTSHDDWVLSVDWAPPKTSGGGGGPGEEPYLLLSVSADRSARLWSPAADDGDDVEGDGLWLCDAVVGDAGSAAALGFSGGCFSPDGEGLAAAGPAGAVHVWRREGGDGGGRGGGGGSDDVDAPAATASSPSTPSHSAPLRRPRRWLARPSAGGHSDAVVDASWAGPDGACLLTVSEDQTARLSTWLDDAGDGGVATDASSLPPALSWAEVARPQTHGHDFSCVAAVLSRPLPAAEGGSSSASPLVPPPAPAVYYASGSEEKVIRVFEAPGAFYQTLAWARGERNEQLLLPAFPAPSSSQSASYGATLPALGLSNRAVHSPGAANVGEGGGDSAPTAELYPEGPDALPAAAPAPLSSRPVEAALAGGTLWPESVKLYGHGAELSALAAATTSTDGARGGKGKGTSKQRLSLFASASAAKASRWAAIRLWTQRQSAPAAGGAPSASSPWVSSGPPHECHSLTVTRLAFLEGRVGRAEDEEGEREPKRPPLLLASPSRDRSFAVHRVFVERGQEGEEGDERDDGVVVFRLWTLCHVTGAHSRALTDCAWAPPAPPSPSSPLETPPAVLATASRDGSVKVWSISVPSPAPPREGGGRARLLLELQKPATPRLSRVPATALAFARSGDRKTEEEGDAGESAPLTLAVGLGDGGVQLWSLVPPTCSSSSSSSSPPSLSLSWSASAAQRHASAVRRLIFAPEWACFGRRRREEEERAAGGEGGVDGGGAATEATSRSDDVVRWLASVGDDGAVRVYKCCYS